MSEEGMPRQLVTPDDLRPMPENRRPRFFHGCCSVDEAWASFLDQFGPWDWFVTLTWAKDPGAERRASDFRYWESRLCSRRNGLGLGRGWRRSAARPRYVLAWEPQRRGAMHAHALMAGPTLAQVHRLTWKEEWNNLAGGFARIYPPESQGGVAAYCTKYVAKGGQLDLSDNIARKLPKAVQGWLSSRRAGRDDHRSAVGRGGESPRPGKA